MGSYSPVEDLPPGLLKTAMEEVIRPVLRQMAADGHPYRGFLYAGLVLTAGGPKVLEFNCRLGDPETQVVLPRLAGDLLEVLEEILSGRMPADLAWSESAAVNVVLAAPGYPDRPAMGGSISVAEGIEGEVLVFHAGTDRTPSGELVVAGGRVLNVVGLGADRAEARERAYRAIEGVRFEGMQYRRDIGR
jgi:phosphoribosylamine--glycine ligase